MILWSQYSSSEVGNLHRQRTAEVHYSSSEVGNLFLCSVFFMNLHTIKMMFEPSSVAVKICAAVAASSTSDGPHPRLRIRDTAFGNQTTTRSAPEQGKPCLQQRSGHGREAGANMSFCQTWPGLSILISQWFEKIKVKNKTVQHNNKFSNWLIN